MRSWSREYGHRRETDSAYVGRKAPAHGCDKSRGKRDGTVDALVARTGVHKEVADAINGSRRVCGVVGGRSRGGLRRREQRLRFLADTCAHADADSRHGQYHRRERQSLVQPEPGERWRATEPSCGRTPIGLRITSSRTTVRSTPARSRREPPAARWPFPPPARTITARSISTMIGAVKGTGGSAPPCQGPVLSDMRFGAYRRGPVRSEIGFNRLACPLPTPL